MTVRFLGDEDIDVDIIQGLRSREPAIDILDVKTAGLRGMKDSVLLQVAAEQDRILITHDRNTMPWHFYECVAAGKSAPGLSIVPQQRPREIWEMPIATPGLTNYAPPLPRPPFTVTTFSGS